MPSGPEPTALWQRSAGHVDRVLKGANPAALPVGTPSEYVLAANLTAVKAINLIIPAAVLSQDDRLIE